jgi:hypothetical protein
MILISLALGGVKASLPPMLGTRILTLLVNLD